MGRPKKIVTESRENVAEKKESKNATIKCVYCESEAVTKIKDTDIGALYSCGCGNRFQK